MVIGGCVTCYEESRGAIPIHTRTRAPREYTPRSRRALILQSERDGAASYKYMVPLTFKFCRVRTNAQYHVQTIAKSEHRDTLFYINKIFYV